MADIARPPGQPDGCPKKALMMLGWLGVVVAGLWWLIA